MLQPMVSGRSCPPRALLFFCLLLVFGPWTNGTRAETVFHDGPPDSTPFFTKPDHARLTSEYAEVSLAVPTGWRQDDHYLFAIPEGDFSAEFMALTVRNRETGEEVDALGGGRFSEEHAERFGNRLTVLELGILRRARVASVRIARDRAVTVDGEPWEIASYTVRLDHDGIDADARPAADDTGFSEGLYRRFAESVLTVPAGLDAFAMPALAGERELPWRPEPELSPGLPWNRIPIREDGLYALDADWLRGAGLPSEELRPEDLQMVREGRRIPLHPLGPDGATFAEGARAVFYGIGNPARETAYRSHYLGRRPDDLPPMPFEAAPSPPEGESPEPLRVYTRRIEARQDNELKTRFGEFLSVQEMVWVWTRLDDEEPAEVTFDLPGLAPQRDLAVVVRCHLYSGTGEFQEGLQLIAGGGGLTEQIADVDPRRGVAEFSWPSPSFRPGENRLRLRLGGEEQGSDFFLEKLTLDHPARLSPQNGLHIHTPAPDVAGDPAEWVTAALTGFRTGVLALDVRDPDSPTLLPPAAEGARGRNYHLSEPGRGGAIFAEENSIPSPPGPENRPFADWQRASLSADILIVTHRRFEEAARQLAEDQERAGHEALVVDVEQLYENFTYGDASTDAIRDFLRHAVHTWEGRRPFTAILVGDSNADGRDTARMGIPNYMPVPVIQTSREGMGDQFSSDSVYSWLSPDNELSDILVARLSPATEEDALNAVGNIVDYRRTQDEKVHWGNRLVSVVDTGEFREAMESVHFNSVGGRVRNDFIVADDLPWEDNYYLPPELIQRPEDTKVGPLVTAAIEEAFHEGAAVMTFFGHGAPNLWSNHRFWFGGGTPNSDILRLENEGRLPFVTTFTCNNAVVDYPLPPWNISIAEDFMRHRNKGAIACFMPSGPGYTSSHKVMAEGFLRAWSELGIREQGLLGEFSRINHQVRREFDDHTRMFLFLGDPTLRLPPLPESPAIPPHSPLEESLMVEGGDVLLDGLRELDPASAGSRRWAARLVNRIATPRTVSLRLEILSPDGETVRQVEREVEVPGRAAAVEELDASLPGPGIYTALFSLPHERGEYFRDRLPSREAVRHVVEGGVGDAPVMLVHTKRLEPGSAGRFWFQVVVYNPHDESLDAELRAERPDGGTLFRAPARLSPGRTRSMGAVLPSGEVSGDRGDIHLRLMVRTDDERERHLADETRVNIGEEMLPRLVVARETINVSPEQLSDGLTVFVEGTLRNDSAVRTPAVNLVLIRGEGEDAERLGDLTSSRPYRFTSMLPGEERPFRLRWDPMNNAGEYEIRVVADPDGQLPLRERELAEATVPLRVRTKANLVTGDMLIGEGETENALRLAAEVANTGGTDARLVAVNFYYAQEQREETKVGEVIVERVPAGSTELVEFLWEPDREEAERLVEPVQPSFTIALRGSLQRVSSVVD